MPCVSYEWKRLSAGSMAVVAEANAICRSYAEQGYDLTLRQLYYQFVARDLLANKQSEYKRLGSIVNDARLGGLLDWGFIVDRTRRLRSVSHWDRPGDVVRSAAFSFAVDRWAPEFQPTRVEVWVEKDALVGVLESCCPNEDVPFFACRGYASQSAMWRAAQRIGSYQREGQETVILYLGDHDPSGLDMTRDVEDRLRTFISEDLGQVPDLSVERIALNMDQIEAYDPPPNPAKLTDSRAMGYVERFGSSSWELDALEPSVLVGLIRSHIHTYRDEQEWVRATSEQEHARKLLTQAAERWDDVADFLSADH